MEGIEQKAIELIEKFEALAVEVAPEAIELGLMAARVGALQAAAKYILIVGVLIWFLSILQRNFPHCGFVDEFINAATIKTIASTAGSLFFGFGAIKTFSIWPFVGIFYPELWIAKQVLGW